MFHGMMTIYKEAGYTSSDVVARLRGILHMKKIGHTGTLDPDAEGVLPVCLGIGTKLCELIADRDKEYIAVMRLGVTTDTQDMSGEVQEQISDEEVRLRVTPQKVKETAAEFVGEISQVPPMYSAVKVDGKRLYEYARAGRTVERKARNITIYELEITSVDLPLVTMRVRCSKGTYIRTLCADIGEKLGCGACVSSLVRTATGGFELKDSLTIDEIALLHQEGRLSERMVSIDSMFPEALRASVKEELDQRLYNGNQFTLQELMIENDSNGTDDNEILKVQKGAPKKKLRLYDSKGTFIGLYRWDSRRRHYHPEKMFLPQ